MTHLIYIYLIINSIFLGSYILDSFNNDSLREKVFCSFLLFFFGGIMALYEIVIADKFEKWLEGTYFKFLWRVYIIRKYDNLNEDQLNFIRGQISAEKDKTEKDSVRLVKHLKIILKRNKQVQDKYANKES